MNVFFGIRFLNRKDAGRYSADVESGRFNRYIHAGKPRKFRQVGKTPLPPTVVQQRLASRIRESHPNNTGGITDDDSVVGNVPCDDRACADDGAVTNAHATLCNDGVVADPRISANFELSCRLEWVQPHPELLSV